jgi:hypothetical protein
MRSLPALMRVAAVAAAWTVGSANIASATIITDGEFSTWTSTLVDPSPGGSFSNSVLLTGGNPGARYYATINGNSDNLSVANIKGDYTNTAGISGPWTLSVDYLQGQPGTTSIMGIAFVIQQGSNFWRSVDSAVVGTSTWQLKSLSGTFNPGSFQAFGSAPASPSFAPGVSTKFGLLTYINGSPATYSSYFDNWKLDNTLLSPVPEPSSAALLAVALGSLFLVRRRGR